MESRNIWQNKKGITLRAKYDTNHFTRKDRHIKAYWSGIESVDKRILNCQTPKTERTDFTETSEYTRNSSEIILNNNFQMDTVGNIDHKEICKL